MANTIAKKTGKPSTQTEVYELTFDSNGSLDFDTLEFAKMTSNAKGTAWGSLAVYASNDTAGANWVSKATLAADGTISFQQERWVGIRFTSTGFKGTVYVTFGRA